jgi:hypothetical protein
MKDKQKIFLKNGNPFQIYHNNDQISIQLCKQLESLNMARKNEINEQQKSTLQ